MTVPFNRRELRSSVLVPIATEAIMRHVNRITSELMRIFRSICHASVLSAACLLLTLELPAQQTAPAKSGPATSPHTHPPPEHGPQLSGQQVSVPLLIVKGYPFIQGAINGQPGDLMFDTGMEPSLILNTRAVTIPDAVKIGQGAASSGQTFDTFLLPKVDHLDLSSGLHFENSTSILGIPADFIQKGVDPRYIASLGDDFFKGYVFKLDYAAPSVTFYRNDEGNDGEAKATIGETAVQTISFDNKGHRNAPIFPITLSGAQAIAMLDTGTHVTIALSRKQMTAMLKAGTLRKKGDNDYLVSGLVIDAHRISALHTQVTVTPPLENDGVSAPDVPVLTLGYEFLLQYKTVWNYERSTLTLLALHP